METMNNRMNYKKLILRFKFYMSSIHEIFVEVIIITAQVSEYLSTIFATKYYKRKKKANIRNFSNFIEL